MLEKILSLFETKKPTDDPWAKWRNPGGPISPEFGEAMLSLTIVGIVIYMIVNW
jgi:hypothetical protein